MKTFSVLRFLGDSAARSVFFLYSGAAFHFLYAAFRLGTGILYRGNSVDISAFFYLSLAVNRLLLIRAYRHRENESAVRYVFRASGKLLFITLGIMLLLIAEAVTFGRPSSYPRLFLWISGIYAIVSATLAILALFVRRRFHAPALAASRAVGLSAALVSAFNFLVDALSVFSFIGEEGRRVLLLSCGASMLLLVLIIAVGLLREGKGQS